MDLTQPFVDGKRVELKKWNAVAYWSWCVACPRVCSSARLLASRMGRCALRCEAAWSPVRRLQEGNDNQCTICTNALEQPCLCVCMANPHLNEECTISFGKCTHAYHRSPASECLSCAPAIASGSAVDAEVRVSPVGVPVIASFPGSRRAPTAPSATKFGSLTLDNSKQARTG